MKSSGELMIDTTLFAQSLPGGGGELGATVADYGGREAEDGNPMNQESLPYSLGGDVGDGNCHREPGRAVNDS